MILSLSGVLIRRGTFTLAAEGDFVEGLHVIQGPVGSGKSSLASALAGTLPIMRGTIRSEGVGSSTLSLQFPEYHVTCFTLAEECKSWRLESQPVLSSLRLSARSGDSPFSLSRGELKRFILACVLEQPADLLLLDEPFSGLDCEQKELLHDHLLRRRKGITIVFTHEREYLPAAAVIWEITCGAAGDTRTLVLKRPTPPAGKFRTLGEVWQ